MTMIATSRIAVLLCALSAGPAVARAQEGDVTPPTVEKSGDSGQPPAAEDSGWTAGWKVHPYAALVGGVEYQTLQTKEDNPAEDRAVTIALSRLGLRGNIGEHVYIESEFEVNAGPHGTSVWEGQAALQVRNQLVRLRQYDIRVDAGRITDDASLDFYSDHVADQLLTDGFTRASLLASGFNRGNGVLIRYEMPQVPGLQPGITINAANPTSTTASLVVGGTFPPFSRFYFAPYQQVGRDASKFPADEYHIVVVTPSVVYRHPLVEAQAAVQMFRVNTNTSTDMDQPIDGFNIRLGAALRLLDDRVHPFANFSVVQNEVVDPNDGTRLSGEIFRGITGSGGVDWNYLRKNGVGVQYALVRDQQGAATRTTQHFVNIGSTWWLNDFVSLGARIGVYSRCEDLDGSGCPEKEGERSFFTTLRTIL